MELNDYIHLGDLVKVTNSASGIVIIIDTSRSKPIGVAFFTGELMFYSPGSLEVLSSYYSKET
tara:strand:+ start:11266 stop:11454 length:189 start_codon:yes stop_codon:yes gene_type:complete